MKKLTLALIAVLTLGSAQADPSPESLALAKDLLHLQRTQEALDATLSSCEKDLPGTSFDPDHLYEKNPNAFWGISPSSPVWPDIVEAYRLYRHEYCQAQRPSDLFEIMAIAYTKKMSDEQLRSAIAFYETDAGQALVAAYDEALLVNDVLQAEQLPQIQKAVEDNFRKRLKMARQKFLDAATPAAPATR